VALPHAVIQSQAYRRLSVYARALLIDIAMQFTRDDNGRLLCSTAFMKPLGWTSQGTLQKAKTELLAGGFIYETVKGQRPHKASWYALTWLPLDRLPGYDEGAMEGFVRSAYAAEGLSVEKRPKPTRQELYERWNKNAGPSPPDGLETPSIGPPHGLEKRSPSPPHGPIRAENSTSSSPPHGNPLEKPSPVPEPHERIDMKRESTHAVTALRMNTERTEKEAANSHPIRSTALQEAA